MITAWQIYWVMQLDSIGAAFAVLGAAAGLLSAITHLASLFDRDMRSIYEGATYQEGQDRYARYGASAASKSRIGNKAAIVAIPVLLLAAFIPSTKTAAAMVVIPAVANNEAIQREAGDLYGIAKNALRELAKPDKAAEESK